MPPDLHAPLFCLGLGLAAVSQYVLAVQPFAHGRRQTGKCLFDAAQGNCCHVNIVGGDGSPIFKRQNSIIADAAALLNRIASDSLKRKPLRAGYPPMKFTLPHI